MFSKSLHRIRRNGLRTAVAMGVSSLALVALTAPAGASTSSTKVSLTPVAVLAPQAAQSVDAADRKRKKKPHKKMGMGAKRPKTQLAAVLPAATITASLPATVDLSSYDVAVGNQGQVGSCVAWAIDYAMLGWYSKHDGRAGQPFHPMYTFSQIHSTNDADGGGSDPEDALTVAQNQGNDTIAHYAHSLTDFRTLPNASERANAGSFRIAGWQRLFSYRTGSGGSAGATMIETALSSGKPVAITMNVRSGFSKLYYKTTAAAATVTDVSTAISGRHEVLAVGYDQEGLWIQNSWGKEYGINGYARLSWAVVAKDVYAAHTISGFASGSNNTDNNNNTTRDTTAPTMGAVTQHIPLDFTVTNTAVPVAFKWSASDASGIAAYAVYVRTDGGSWTKQDAVAANATSYTFSLSIGHTYTIGVSAKDGAGNWSGYAYSPAVAPSVVDDTTYNVSSPWGRYTNFTDSFGGTYIASSEASSWIQKTFTGTDIALVAPKFSNGGRGTVYCDGSSIGMIDLNSASVTTRGIQAYCHFPQSGEHTMKVVAEGTSTRPWLAVDAFAIL